MSFQYKVPGFEDTTFGTWVSSHNHYLDQDSLPRRPFLLIAFYLPKSASS